VTLALSFLLALVVSATLVVVSRTVALRLRFIVPPAERQAPGTVKTLFGGVAIAVTVAGCTIALGLFPAVPVVLLSGLAMCGVGLASDFLTLKPSTKFVVVIAVASVFLLFDYRLYWAESQTLDGIITLFWIVGVTGAFHLLDNMDGLCGGTALIAGTAFLVTILPAAPGTPLFLQAQYVSVLLGAVTGFLIFNIHPALVAMGEAGSLLVGLNMAAMTISFAPGRGTELLSIIAVPALLLVIPIVDAALAAVSRLMSGTAVHEGQEHSSQRLVAIGLSERAAVGLLWVLAAASGMIAVIAERDPGGFTGVVAAMFIIAMGLFAVYLARVRVHEDVDPNRVRGTIMPLGIAFGYRRRIVEVMLDMLLVSIAYYGAFRLRYEGDEWAARFDVFRQSFPIVLGTQMVALFAVGVYRGLWRYFSLHDGVMFAKGVFAGVLAAQIGVLFVYRFDGYSGATFFVYGLLLMVLLVGSRASFRLFSEFAQRQRRVGKRLVIYGAGAGGSIAVRQVLHDARSAYRIVGFIDDNVSKRNARVHGYRVIGGYDHLVGMIMAGEVDVVAVTHEGGSAAALPWLCTRYGVTLYRTAIDWHEIRATESIAAGGGVALSPSDSRVVRFTDARRARVLGEPASPLQEAAPLADAPGGPHPAANRPIRVVHIITRLILGGAQENTLYTAIGQHHDPRFEVTLLCGIDEAGEGNMFAEINRAGVKTVVMPSLLREIRPLTDIKALFDLYRFLMKGDYTVVHTHSSKAGVLGRLAARAANVPAIVHTIHGVAFHEFQSQWKNRTYIALERMCAPLCDRIISVSRLLGEAAIARGIGRPEQHVTIFSGIDLELFLTVGDRLSVADAKQRLGIPPDAPVVGKIARFFPLKGHDQFLAAAAAVARELPETYFLLVGDGPLRDDVRRDAERLGIGDRIVMVGRVLPETVPEYIQAMDVVVHTSLREGIARVLPQAGAVGKPVVTFALDGAPEVVRHGVSGYLVPALDTGHVAERIIELLRDADKRRAFGDAGRAFAAEHFSVDRMVERISSVYLELVDPNARAQHGLI